MQRARGSRWRKPRCAAWAALALAAVLAGRHEASAARTRMSLEFFASSLEPYGSWHVSASYGRVWIPRVQVIDWHPYAYGHWVYTDFGWTWVSDYEWGAIPYHYGTWVIEPELGWAWVPGYVWAPAWVVFRAGPSYIGWAPVSPSFAIGAKASFESLGADHYVFVRESELLAPNIHHHAVPRERTRVIFGDTAVVRDALQLENDVVVNRGVDVQRIERVARAPVERAPIERVPRVAPVDRVTVDALRVEPDQIDRGVRAAAPTKESPPREPPRKREGNPRG